MNITKAILENTNTIMTVSSYDTEYGTYLGQPTVIGAGGAERVMHLELSKDEQTELDASVLAIKTVLNSLNK